MLYLQVLHLQEVFYKVAENQNWNVCNTRYLTTKRNTFCRCCSFVLSNVSNGTSMCFCVYVYVLLNLHLVVALKAALTTACFNAKVKHFSSTSLEVYFRRQGYATEH